MVIARSDEPTSLREQQRQATRAWIRKSARNCFLREGASTVSMDTIAREAGIRRATLYLYYPSKGALLLDLLDQSLRATGRIYRRLAELSEITWEAVRQWLKDYVDEVGENKQAVDLFRSQVLPDKELRLLLREHHERTIIVLGERFRAFDMAAWSGRQKSRRRFEAEWIIDTIDRFCGEAWDADYPLDSNVGLDVLAERLLVTLTDDSR
jgi:AcrR family transcriptional regulator